ncbi:uncharacterized protein LOC107774830 [Nicotiana tabacum]|uniref:Uncharacterized protein LOC107774830 n=2 Tax=Nicotiana TaxID=4085 RepID=A0A1S3YCN2_TOBAC|nr:PREDICTED: uncharacterized protein LOC104243928 [Nicotiana sylvestris]XP_016449965.1 PREDICTED: uncharacterized protein LOC107774830 [Nicotiana tabacum]
MSQGSSSSSYGSRRKCCYGVVASQFTAWTPNNAGRRFNKCSMPNGQKCKFWELVDDELPVRVTALISNLKNENEALRRERNLLLMKVVEIESVLAGDVAKIEDFKELDDVKGDKDVSKEKMDGGLVSVKESSPNK